MIKSKHLKTFLGIFICLCLIIGIGFALPFATKAAGTPVTEGMTFVSGETYTISTVEQWNIFASLVTGDLSGAASTAQSGAGCTFVLTANLDFSGKEAKTVGNKSGYRAFAGVFDGDYYKISNFAPTEASTGLFGYVTGTVKNLKVDAMTIANADGYIGAVVGYLEGGTVQSCTVTSSTLNVGTGYSNGIGGVVGAAEGNFTIKSNTASDVNITSSYFAGGIVGCIGFEEGIGANAVLANCTVSGTTNTIEAWGSGGIAGYIALGSRTLNVDDCKVSNVSINATNIGGGLIGQLDGKISITNCHAANVAFAEQANAEIGGFVGEYSSNGNNEQGVIYNCSLTGADMSGASAYKGGFVGKIYLSYNGSSLNTSASYVNNVTFGTGTNVGSYIGGAVVTNSEHQCNLVFTSCSVYSADDTLELSPAGGLFYRYYDQVWNETPTDTITMVLNTAYANIGKSTDASYADYYRTNAQYASGELAYLLQDALKDADGKYGMQIWGQNLDEANGTVDPAPVFYKTYTRANSSYLYSNKIYRTEEDGTIAANTSGAAYYKNSSQMPVPENSITFDEYSQANVVESRWTYLIMTEEDLLTFNRMLIHGENFTSSVYLGSGTTVLVGADITLTGTNNWVPYRFDGTFKSDDDTVQRTISGVDINITEGNKSYIGFFSEMNAGGIQNIKLANANITATSGSVVGGFAGYINGLNRTLKFENLEFNGNITVNTETAYVGGLFGELYFGSNQPTVDNLVFNGNINVEATEAYVGGILGSWYGTHNAACFMTWKNLTSSGTINAKVTNPENVSSANNNAVGGIVGRYSGAVYIGYLRQYRKPHLIENCTSDVTINLTATDKNVNVGGIAGFAGNTTLQNNKFSGDINVKFDTATETFGALNLGGIVGEFLSGSDTYTYHYTHPGHILNCESTGDIRYDASGKTAINGAIIRAGGIAGYWRARYDHNTGNRYTVIGTNTIQFTYLDMYIEECSFIGTIDLPYSTGAYIGGIAGKMFAEENPSSNGGDPDAEIERINNCYSICTLSKSGYTGGILGFNGDRTWVYNSYSVPTFTLAAGSSLTPEELTAAQNEYGIVGNDESFAVQSYFVGNTSIESSPIGGGVRITQAQVESGELAFLLQGDQTGNMWSQKIDEDGAGTVKDPYPTLGTYRVYKNGEGEAASYSNTSQNPITITFSAGTVTGVTGTFPVMEGQVHKTYITLPYPSEIQKPGNTFSRWRGPDGNIYSAGDTYYLATGDNLTFTATWNTRKADFITIVGAPKTVYSVGDAFDANGATVTLTYDNGETVENVAITAEMLTGFSTDATAVGATATVTYEGKTATFTYDVYGTPIDVTLNAGGGTGTLPTLEGVVLASGNTITLPTGEGLSKAGYTFAGWKASSDGVTYAAGASFTLPADDVTLTAAWKLNAATVESIKLDGTPLTLDASQNASTTFTYDGATHNIVVTPAHELNVTYTYKLYKVEAVLAPWMLNESYFEGLTAVGTSNTFSARNVADSGIYYLVITAHDGENTSFKAVGVSVTVAKALPTAWASVSGFTYGGADIDLTQFITTTNSLPWTASLYSSSGVTLAISGKNVTSITKAGGEFTVFVEIPETDNYHYASAQITFTLAKGVQNISIAEPTESYFVKTQYNFTLSGAKGTASFGCNEKGEGVELTVLSNGTVTVTNRGADGKVVLTAVAAATDLYAKAETSITFYAQKLTAEAPATLPSGLYAYMGSALSTATLPEGYTWQNGGTVMSTIGNAEEKALYNPDSVNYNPVEVELTVAVKSNFAEVNISLGKDITVNYYTVKTNLTSPEMRFTINGYTKTVQGVPDGNEYKFVFDGVAPQWMGDEIKAELICGGTVVETKYYTVKAYLDKILSMSEGDFNMSTAKYNAMVTLVKDLLVYGGAAQKYTGHNADTLVSDGIVGTTFTNIPASDVSVKNGTVTFKHATVFFDSVNSLRFRFTASDLEGIVFKLQVNGGAEAEIGYVNNGDGTYTIETDAIYANGFDDIYTITAYKNGAEDAKLTYSVKSYIYAKQSGTGNMAELAKATYNYGISAHAYINAE